MIQFLHKAPFLRLTASLSAGIIAGHYTPAELLSPFGIFTVLFILLILLVWLNVGSGYYRIIWWGLVLNLFFLIGGLLIYKAYNRKPVFYDSCSFLAVVKEIPIEKPNSNQTVLQIHSVFKNDSVFPTCENILVWFENTNESKYLKPGNVIFFNQNLHEVKNNNNPFEFDYKQFLARKKIYRQVYLPDRNWQKNNRDDYNSIPVLAQQVRMHLLGVFGKAGMDERSKNILSALSLGYKDGLNHETRQLFTVAGTMHVLAVSGLHTGIIFLIVSQMLGFLRKQKAGKVLFVLFVIGSLWAFAFVTGLAPSVKRAATMFTFVVVGQNLNRQVNIYNSLAASAFFILLFNPNNLFEPGFQLSYSAVLGIVYLHPLFLKLYSPENLVLKYLYGLLTLSVAAQISTFPFSVYYFKQFPTYFWLSNLIAIPVVSVLIPLAIIWLSLNCIPFFSVFISMISRIILKYFLLFLKWIEDLPYAVLSLHFESWQLMLLVLTCINLVLFFEFRKPTYIKSSLLFLLIYFLLLIGIRFNNLNRSELIVYNYESQRAVHLISGTRNYVITERLAEDDQYLSDIINRTVVELDLEKPISLIQSSDYDDSILYLHNGLICFSGRVIYFNSRTLKVAGPTDPNIIINSNGLIETQIVNQGLLPNKSVKGEPWDDSYSVHRLSVEGAYRKSW